MKTLSEEQHGDAWHEFRSKGIGASEAPAVLGECDFKTPLQLWELKTGRREREKTNFAMQRGTNAEPKIRALYELRTGIDAQPALGIHADHPFMRASFDGLNADENIVIEFKYPSAIKHSKAKAGEVPLTYKAQLQHQLFVSGAKRCDYVSYDGKDIVIVPVLPDYPYMEKLFKACQKFWKLVETDTPPEASDKDYKVIKNKDLAALGHLYGKVKRVIDDNKADLEKIKAEIFKLAGTERFVCGEIKAITKTRVGAVDYKAIPELNGVNLDSYRKKSIEVREIRMMKP